MIASVVLAKPGPLSSWARMREDQVRDWSWGTVVNDPREEKGRLGLKVRFVTFGEKEGHMG